MIRSSFCQRCGFAGPTTAHPSGFCPVCNTKMVPVEYDWIEWLDRPESDKHNWIAEHIIMDDKTAYYLTIRTNWEDNRDRQFGTGKYANQPRPVDTPHCPICNSTDLTKLSSAGKVAKIGLFGIFGAGDLGKTWKCNNCGSKF